MQPAQKFHTIPFVASLLICSIACTSSADTPQIRVGIQAKIENGNDAQIVSAPVARDPQVGWHFGH